MRQRNNLRLIHYDRVGLGLLGGNERSLCRVSCPIGRVTNCAYEAEREQRAHFVRISTLIPAYCFNDVASP